MLLAKMAVARLAKRTMRQQHSRLHQVPAMFLSGTPVLRIPRRRRMDMYPTCRGR